MTRSSPLARLLADCARARLRALLGTSALFAVAGCTPLLVLAIGLDALIGFGRSGLVLLDLSLLSAAAVAGLGCGLRFRRARLDTLGTAAYVERRAGVPHNRLLNALALSQAAPAGSSAQLIAHSVALADACAARIEPRSIVDYAPLKRGLSIAGGVFAVALGLAAGFPRVVTAVVPRLLAPTADKPAYCPIDFDLEIEPAFVRSGASATFEATLWGKSLPEAAQVIIRDAAGHSERLGMSPRTPGSGPPERRAFAYQLYNVTAPLWLGVSTALGDSAFIPLRLAQLQGVEVEFDYPRYTGLPRVVQPLADASIRAVVGTQVKLIARTLDARADIRLSLEGAGANGLRRELAMQPVGQARVAATFEIQGDGRWALQPAAAAEPLEPALRGEIKAATDQPPALEIVEPARHVIAAENIRVQVELRARDDFGVASVRVRRAINGWSGSSRELPLPAERRDVRVDYEFDLQSLGARAGDVITYSASVADNHPSGKQYAESELYTIEVISLPEYESFARSKFRVDELQDELEQYHTAIASLQQRQQALAEPLAALERALRAGTALTPEQRRQLSELETELAEQAAQSQKLAAALRARAEKHPLFDFERAYQQHLKALAKQLAGQAAPAQQLEKALARERTEGGGDLAQASERYRRGPLRQTEPSSKQIAADVAKLRGAEAMQRQLERIRYVLATQRQLADRLRELRDDGSSPLTAARLERSAGEQLELPRELRDAGARLEQLAHSSRALLPKMSASAQELTRALAALKVTQDQTEAAARATKHEAAAAFDAAERAARKLESLQSEAGSKPGGASRDLDGCLGLTKLTAANALQQLAEAGRMPGGNMPGSRAAAGSEGSLARMQVVGPSAGQDPGLKGNERRALFKNTRSEAEAVPSKAVTITPDSLSPYTGDQAERRGVPARYQPSVDAYFKRLAEDQRTEQR